MGDPLREWGAARTVRVRVLSAVRCAGGGLLVLGSLLACGPVLRRGWGGRRRDGAGSHGRRRGPPGGCIGVPPDRELQHPPRSGHRRPSDLERRRALRRLQPDLVGSRRVDRGRSGARGLDQGPGAGAEPGHDPPLRGLHGLPGGRIRDGDPSPAPGGPLLGRSPAGGERARVGAAAAYCAAAGAIRWWRVNVHFDWVATTRGFRFCPGPPRLAAGAGHPYPTRGSSWGTSTSEHGSRTLELSQARRRWRRTSPRTRPFTFSSDDPRKGDRLHLAAPAGAWQVLEARVVDERPTSDHLPVLAVLEWNGGEGR